MRPVFFLFFWLALHAHADSRQVFSADSPPWMAAIGKLEVPGQKFDAADVSNLFEHCTATLIGGDSGRTSRYILSAWHCLEYYRDLSRPIVFTLPGTDISREAFVVASGGAMSADWALLRLQEPVSREQVKPFTAWTRAAGKSGTRLTMAGYSSDGDLGRDGAVLTYDAGCRALASTPNLVATDCTAFKGASGGPVVSQEGNALQLMGVISVGDSENRSFYTPLRLFASSLRLHLP
jgi:hypothetical protein